jgi:hypothetical protein
MEEKKPALLKKLPSRWKTNAKIVACISLAGALSLSGLAAPFAKNNFAYAVEQNASGEFDLVVRIHSGGSGSMSYVVHLTEQEAANIIRTQLEAAGLTFGAVPPNLAVKYGDRDSYLPSFGINLYDSENRVAISQVSWADNHIGFFSHGGSRLAEEVAERFAAQASDITFGVFYNPSKYFWAGRTYDYEASEPSAEEVAESRPFLESELNAQIAEFVLFLQAEGILSEQSNEIQVLLNGTPLAFDVAPIISNGRVMVPMRAIFEALGMTVTWDSEMGYALASKDELTIDIFTSTRDVIMVNREMVELEAPIIVQSGRILVPLRVIAEATGAEVEWNQSTRMVVITCN